MKINCVVSGCSSVKEFSGLAAAKIDYMCSNHDRKTQLNTVGRLATVDDFMDRDTHFQTFQFDPNLPRGQKTLDEDNE